MRVGGIAEAFETVRQAKDGTPIDVSVVSSAIRDSSGAVVGIGDRELAIDAGASDYIQKPISTMDLPSIIRRHLPQ